MSNVVILLGEDPEDVPEAVRRQHQYPSANFYERDVSWHADAACAEIDTEMFFPEKGGSTREAKDICADCLVQFECLDYALATGERFGIWGGTSERERRRLQRDFPDLPGAA